MKRNYLVELLVLLISLVASNIFLSAESGIYDRIGIIREHGLHGTIPEENIDLFTGNLTLKFLDVYLPGPNGFDLKVWRVYNSKILRDRLPGSLWGIQQEPYSWVGMGWSMHMGRVHYFASENPVIEFPDGRWETVYLAKDSSEFITREFLKYDKWNYKLYFKDGTIWTFGEQKHITYVGGWGEEVRVVTRIENSFGHHIDIIYNSTLPTISKITDSMEREVNFITSVSTNPKLQEIRVKNATGGNVSYYYTVSTFSQGGYYKLTQFLPPHLYATTYEYADEGQYDHYELTAVNTSFKGKIEYAYEDHTFYFEVQPLETRVLKQKKIRFFINSVFKVWTYTYPDYQNVATGTVTVQGPEFDFSAEYHAYTSEAPWKIGLLKKKWYSDDSYSEAYEWVPEVISYTRWLVLNIDMGYATAPLVFSILKTRKGDSDSEDLYFYERESIKKYGLPTKIEYWAEGSQIGRKDFRYFFEDTSIFESKYMLSYIGRETQYDSIGTKLKETQTSFFTDANRCGAIDWVKRWKSENTYLIWDHDYSSSNPSLITINIDLPGENAGTETYEYSYGVLSKVIRPGYDLPELTRTISQHDSSILTETNEHGGTINFTYDNLGRVRNIDLPSGFYDIQVNWAYNQISIYQGNTNSIIRYLDGLARDLGYDERGDGIRLFSRKTLDAEGRIIEENKTSNNELLYKYELTASGQIKKITDPRQKITLITYSDNKKTVTDPENRVTEFTFSSLPGFCTTFKDAAGRYSENTYDAIGRLTSSVYNNSRTQIFSYDGLDNLTSETHPETGTISYSYNPENNLWQKTWGQTQISYLYNQANQIKTANSGDEIITYTYDPRGRVESVSSDKGWSRDSITYNLLGSVTGEQQTIPGLGTKSISYSWDGFNNLGSLTYPDGKIATYTTNSLKMPETLSFNGESLIGWMQYGHSKRIKEIGVMSSILCEIQQGHSFEDR